MTLKTPKRRFVDNGPKVEILSMPDSGPIKPASGHVASDLSQLWNLTAAAPRQVSGPSLQELDDAADGMAAVVATQLGRVAGFAARNLGGVTIAASASPLWTFHLPGQHDQDTHGHGVGDGTVLDAYKKVARPGDWANLADVRDEIGDAPKSEVDAALKRLVRKRGVHFAPQDYQSKLTQRDRAAAIVIGGQPNHLMMVEPGVTASGLWTFQTGIPRQAAVSPDDLAVIRDQWTVITDDVLGPKIAADYLAGAKGQHNRLAAVLPPKVRGLAGRPLADQAALLYAAGAANRLKGIGDELWQAARTALLEGMAKGEPVDKLARRIRDATGIAIGRATTIARTESMGARSAGSYDEMLASGVVVSKTWQATGDLRTRPTHVVADGQTVPMAEKFTVGGWPADRPHDPMLPAEEAVNCRCTLTYGVDTDVATGDMTLAEAISARQAEMDAVAPLAEGIANLEELIPREDLGGLRRHIDSLARRHTIDPEMRDDWLAAVEAQDLRRLRRAVNRAGKDADLSPIGQAGQRVAFDPAVHTVLAGGPPEVGASVEVLRRGYRLVRGGESILLFKAVVEVLATAASGLWVFHLSGQHDQSSHGHGGGMPAELHSEAALRKTFDYHDEATGLTTRVTSIRGGDADRSTYVDIKVTDRDGNIVGGGTRTIHAAASESVAHSGFAIERGVQGQGFMTRYNQQVERSYRGHGIKRIEIHASGGQAGGMQLVGGYAWAKAGYDFTPDSRAVVGRLATIKYTGGSSPYSRDIQAQIFRVARNPNASPIDYAMIGYRPGAKTWPGKEIMLNMSWDGVKTL